jgi:Fic family protein
METQPAILLPTTLLAIDSRKAELDRLRGTLDNATIRTALNIEFLYESNRIEGNTLTLRETQLVLQEGMTISGKSLREHLEAINHNEALAFIEELAVQKAEFSEYALKQIHALVLHGIDHDNAGRYRTVPVLIAGSKHIPPQAHLLQSLMDEYFRAYTAQKEHLHPVVLAAELHERLVTIHPFIDGNGRTARLVMNLILLRHGFPLAIIGGDYESRMAYYDALEHAQTEGSSPEFAQFIAEKVLSAIERYLTILGKQ